MSDSATGPAIVRRARSGDPVAWDQLFKRYQRPLYVFACELLHHESRALDAVQETFINASRHIGSLREDTRFGSWLFGIAHQKCQQQLRQSTRDARWQIEMPIQGNAEEEPNWDETAPDSSQPDPAAWLIRVEQEDEFLRCLDQLPDAQRTLLLLRFVDDFSLAEIATITGVPVGTVKSRLHHARGAFRHLLPVDLHLL